MSLTVFIKAMLNSQEKLMPFFFFFGHFFLSEEGSLHVCLALTCITSMQDIYYAKLP